MVHGTHEGAGWPKAFQIGHPGAEDKDKAEFIQQQQALTHDMCEVNDVIWPFECKTYVCCIYLSYA
jgi:hypothetical protein